MSNKSSAERQEIKVGTECERWAHGVAWSGMECINSIRTQTSHINNIAVMNWYVAKLTRTERAIKSERLPSRIG